MPTSILTTPAYVIENRRNLAPNPNAAVGGGFIANSGTVHDVGRGACPAGHPQGITTGAWSRPKAGQSISAILSMYNVDTLGVSGSVDRQVGAWVYVSTSATDYQCRIGSARGIYVAVPANTWTWVTGPGFNGSNNFCIVDVVRAGGGVVASSDIAYITGVTTLAVPTVIPQDAVWGGRAASGGYSYAWAGAANASESIEYLTAPTLTPDVVHGYTAQRQAGTIVHPILGSAEADVSLRPATRRAGVLDMLFSTAAAALRAEAACVFPQVLTLTSDEQPGLGMKFVVADGSVDLALTDSRKAWLLSVPYQEVAP